MMNNAELESTWGPVKMAITALPRRFAKRNYKMKSGQSYPGDTRKKKDCYSPDRDGTFHSLKPHFIPKVILLNPVLTIHLNLFANQKVYSNHIVPHCDFSGSENGQLFFI
jgi:hypothetical protein